MNEVCQDSVMVTTSNLLFSCFILLIGAQFNFLLLNGACIYMLILLMSHVINLKFFWFD